MKSLEYIELHSGPPWGTRLRYVALAWGVALLTVMPVTGLAIIWVPFRASLIALRGNHWAPAGVLAYFILITVLVFVPFTHRPFRYSLYLLIISLTAAIIAFYGILSRL